MTRRRRDDYAVVHLVAQESHKDLVGPQAIDQLSAQLRLEGDDRPARVILGLLEPARVALRGAMRERLAELRARDPGVTIALLPYVSRIGLRGNAPHLAARVRMLTGGLPIVFHCRGESGTMWAMELRRFLPRSGIVLDARGAWPEEWLFMHGVSSLENADAGTRATYDWHIENLRTCMASASGVFAVSPGLVDWLVEVGAHRGAVEYVPCCVTAVADPSDARAATRRELGLDGKIVYSYLGILDRYQHVEDIVVPFFRAIHERYDDAHLLALTNEPERFVAMLEAAGVDRAARTVLRVPQRDVPRYLPAADIGFVVSYAGLQNDRSPLGRIVQPIKLAEYLASGVPILTMPGIGRVDALVAESGAGIVTEMPDDPAARAAAADRVHALLRDHQATMRERALELCRREFVWSSYVPRIRAAYRRALRGDAPALRVPSPPTLHTARGDARA